jgi:hypothetical protein
MGEWCADVAAAIRRRWPDTDVDLSKLPPFVTRDEEWESVIATARS